MFCLKYQKSSDIAISFALRYIILMKSGEELKPDIDRRIQAYQKQLRRLASELSLAEARERREIASDLHDHIGQALAFVTQKVTSLRGNAVFSGMEEDFSEILDILEQTIRYTRDLTVEISPPILYELGLAAAIDWLADRVSRRYKLKVTVIQSGDQPDIDENIRVFIFKAIQELLNNVARHAKARQAKIHTDWGTDNFTITVSDDGCGFDSSSFAGDLSRNCFGLFSIRERLSYIGGRLTIDSSPGKGTRIEIVAPCKITAGGQSD